MSRAWVQEFHRTRGNSSTLEGYTEAFTLGPRVKQWLHRSLDQTYLRELDDLQGKQGLSMVGNDMCDGGPREHSLVWALPEVATLVLRPGPSQQLAGSSARAPQAKQATGWENSPIHQWIGHLKLLWGHSHLQTYLLTCHATRGRRPSSNHQREAPVLPTRKPAKDPGPNSHTREQTQEERGTTLLQTEK